MSYKESSTPGSGCIAFQMGAVVLAVSSGAGWTTGGQTPLSLQISNYLRGVGNSFQIVTSQNFTKNEADAFIKKYMIDSKKLGEEYIETNNNPRILCTFEFTLSYWSNVQSC